MPDQRILLPAVLCFAFTGCAEPGDKPTQDQQSLTGSSDDVDTTRVDSAFRDQLLEIARVYTSWHRVDDGARLAPQLCQRMQMSPPRMSSSTDSPTHGKKIYYVSASCPGDYLDMGKHGSKPIPVGQIVVKEAWPAEVDPSEPASQGWSSMSRGSTVWVNTCTPDGPHVFRADTSGSPSLFVIAKTDRSRGSDHGWLYGTVAPNGEVTSAGVVDSCVKCHVRATHERLFGLAPP